MNQFLHIKSGECPTRKNLKLFQIISAVYREPGISRSELCERLDLNKNNMTSTINGMLKGGVLIENAKSRDTSGVGRRKIGLFLRADLFCTIGASLTLEEPSLTLVNAQRQTIERCPLLNEGSILTQRFLEEIKQKIKFLLSKANGTNILGIGVTLPGIVDFSSGEVLSSQAFNGYAFNIRSFLAEQFGLESFLINVSHLGPVTEKLFGLAAGMNDFVVIDEGLGMGMFLNGGLYTGWQHSAGELGYMKISDSPEIGPDGRTGLLYAKAIFSVIGNKLASTTKNGGNVKIASTRKEGGYIAPEIIVKAVEEGNMFVAQLLSDVFSSIGDAVVNVAYLLNPEAVFLPGWTARCPRCTLEIVKMKMGSYGLSNWRLRTEILAAKSTPAQHAETVAFLYAEGYFKKIIAQIKGGGK